MTTTTPTIPAEVLDRGFLANNSELYRGMRWHLALTEKRAACGETLSHCMSGEGHRFSRELLCQACLTLFEAAGRTYSPETCACGHC